jgi:hypothetical protein
MIEITAPFAQQEFALAPEGTQPAICYGVILIGTIPGKFGPKKMIRLLFELHGDEKMPDGRPFSVTKDFNFSSNESSNLRVFIEDWRGKKYTTPELKELGGLPISKLIGQPALVSIAHTIQDDNTWVNIKTIMRPPKGMETGQLINEKVIYSVDDHDADTFAKLSVKMQDKIKGTAEWQARTNSGPLQNEPSHAIPSDFDDEIPF